MAIKNKLALTLALILGVGLSIKQVQATIITGTDNGNNILIETVTADASLSESEVAEEEMSESGDWGFTTMEQTNFVSLDVITGAAFNLGSDLPEEPSFTELFVGEIFSFTEGWDESSADPDEHYTFTDEYSLGALGSPWLNVVFSVNDCLIEMSDEVGGGCLNKLDAGTAIDESWFDGTNGYAAYFGALYYEGEYIENVNGSESISTEQAGNWMFEGDSGYVAFAYDFSGNNEGDFPFNEDQFDLNSETVGFGFLEITRGSVNVTTMVTTNPVPAPAGAALLLFGLLGIKLRQKAKLSN